MSRFGKRESRERFRREKRDETTHRPAANREKNNRRAAVRPDEGDWE